MTTIATLKRCELCRFFVPGRRISTEEHDGTCHAAPPGNYTTPHPDNGSSEVDTADDGTTVGLITFVDGTYTGWPIVLASDWCGYYSPTRKPKENA